MNSLSESQLRRAAIVGQMGQLTTFLLGLFIGAGAIWLLRTPSAAVLPQIQRAEMVLVVQTATPAAAALPSESQAPTIMATVETTATIAEAPTYARMGEANAPVQIVIFADPQCPYCRQHALETEPAIIEQYVKTGKAALTYRHFTFLGAESQRIAQAMVCAGQQSREAFWAFHQYAFAHQFPENSGQATEDTLLSWAQAVKLNSNSFKSCLNSDAAKSQIEADNTLGQKLHITGTPTLFINGRPLPGALSFEMVKGVIEEELAKK